MFGRRRLRPRLGDAFSRDGGGRRALSRCAFGRGNRRPLAPTPQHMVSASVAPEPRHMYAFILGADGRSRTCVQGRVRRRSALLPYLDSGHQLASSACCACFAAARQSSRDFGHCSMHTDDVVHLSGGDTCWLHWSVRRMRPSSAAWLVRATVLVT